MKKVILSVAALAIAMSGFSQCVNSYEDSVEAVKLLNKIEIVNTAEDMIEYIMWDVENGRIYKEYAEMYIENLQEIIVRARAIQTKHE